MAKKGHIPWNKGKANTKKYIYYTDGKTNLRVVEGTPCPDGFHRGRTTRQLTTEELENARKKQIETCLKKYGVECTFQAKEVKDKIKQTCLDRYGVEYSAQAEITKQHIKETSLERYGTTSPVQTEECKEKRAQTNLQKYGEINPWRFGSPLFTSNLMKIYGVHNARIIPSVIQSHAEKIDEIVRKCTEAKRRNGTFNVSKPEEVYYESLCKQYGIEDIIRQYTDDRYPYACDFYIKSLDLFIELNLTWTHGEHPFDPNNEDDLNKLSRWKEKAKTSDYYKNAVYTWTDLDVRKQNIAKENNLNYIVVYTID